MIHQFYFTHCTYASSALERKSGEVGPHPLGYSVRSSSVQGPALREIFRRLEHYVYYYLPTDTSAQEKETGTDANSPKRLVFLPETDFGPVLMQLAYRPKDTAGRIGSYFCHVLAGDDKKLEKFTASAVKSGLGSVPPTPPNPPASSVSSLQPIPTPGQTQPAGASTLTAHTGLQLWDAAGWVSKEEEWFPHDLEPFDSLQEVLGNNAPAIDDRVLASFLTTESGGTFYDPKQIIPERWRKMLLTERQQIFKTILYGSLLTRDMPGENLLLVVEPSMAALLFYGIGQFFPQVLFRTQSFSTYEPIPDRLVTKLAATTFQSPEQNDLNDAVYHSRSFVLNTWNGRTSNFDAAELTTSYVSHIWKQFLAGGLTQVKTFCSTFNSVGITTMNDLKALMDVENIYHQIMRDEESTVSRKKPLPEKLSSLPLSTSRTAVTLLKRRIADGLTKIMAQPLPEAEKTLKNIIGTPGQLLLLELLGTGGNIPNVQNAVKYLTDSLPMEFLARWLNSSQASDEYKGKLLEKWFFQLRTMPKDCEFLWKISVESLQSQSSIQKPPVPNANVLPETLIRLPHDVLWDVFNSAAVVPFQKEMVLAYTLGVSRLVERDGALNENVMAIRKRLDQFIQKVPESLFGQIYREFGNWFFLNYPGDSLFLGEKFAKLEERIFLKPAEICGKLEILFDIQDILPERLLPRIKRWQTLRKSVQGVVNFQAQPGKKFQFRVLDQACEALAQATYEVFDDTRFLAACGGPATSEFAKIGKINNAQRNRMVEQELAILPLLFRQWYGADFLPAKNKSHELLQKKLKFYLQTKEWKSGGVSLGGKPLILAIAGGIGLGLLVALLLLFSLTSGKKEKPAADQPLQLAVEGNGDQNAEETPSSSAKKEKKSTGKKKKTSESSVAKEDLKPTDETESSETKSGVSRKSGRTEETTYLPETDDETAQLADAEVSDEDESAENDEDPDANSDENGPDDEAAQEEQPIRGKTFLPTDPAQMEKWDKKLNQDGFCRFVKLELAPTSSSKLDPDYTALRTRKSTDRWFTNEPQVANLKLERGYVLFEGTAFPFGESNCVTAPIPEENELNAKSETEAPLSAESKPAVPPKAGKNVLTAEKDAATHSDDEPGVRYSLPELAEALGVKKVYVVLEDDQLTLHVQKNEQTDDEIDALSAEVKTLTEQYSQLVQTVALCKKSSPGTIQRKSNFNTLADLVGKSTFKNQPEKQADLLTVAEQRKGRLEKQIKLKSRNLPGKESVWTPNEEEIIRRLQGRKQNNFLRPAEDPARTEIAAVFSGNFFYDLPLPTGVQNFLNKNAAMPNPTEMEENPDEILETEESTEELADQVYDRLEDGFQESFSVPETDRLYVMAPASTEKELKEGKDVYIEKAVARRNEKQNSIRFQIGGQNIPANLHITARIREIIPGNPETRDRQIGPVSSETEPIVLSDETDYVLVSLRIQNSSPDLTKDKSFVTPYFLIRLNPGEDRITGKCTLTIHFGRKFLGKFTSETTNSKPSLQDRLSTPQKARGRNSR
ncbi:MAG: hypothetical protein IJQ31_06810 [Thermoguttaceae bacterium]|nr:hypothetical protein [Thermoguttaceae bacterium]